MNGCRVRKHGLDREPGNQGARAAVPKAGGKKPLEGLERKGPPMKIRSMKQVVAAFAVLAATAGAASAEDAAAGEKVFTKCRACHQIGETAKNAVGPILNGLPGRKTGSIEGYSYSEANKNSGFTWDEATFKEYIRNPKAKIPGTKMIFPGLTKDEDVDNVWAFLKQYDKDGKKAP
jgi:cytochrome c